MKSILKKEHLVPTLLIATMGYLLLLAVALLMLPPFVRSHILAAVRSDGTLFDSGQSLGNANSRAVALGDLDGDDDLDAFVANGDAATPNRVWLNDGAATFSSNGQSLGVANSHDVALGDLDGDDDLDAFLANEDGANRVWVNQGNGQFVDSGQSLGGGAGHGVALGDLDGDGDLDAFLANSLTNTIWFNDGGVFSDGGQGLGSSYSNDVALGDLDGDDDLDAFVANGVSGAQADTVWLNGGNGVFTDSGQSLVGAWSYAVALGDLDGDDDLDAFTASWFPSGNKVWINQGGVQGGTPGTFADSGLSLGDAASLGVALGDLDGDGDLDAFVANNFPPSSQVWVNAGSFQFNNSGQNVGDTTSYGAALGDLDGDDDLDVFVANFGPDKVWLNGDPGASARFDVDRQRNENGDDVYYWASSGDAFLPIMLGRAATQPVNVHTRVEALGGTITEVIAFDVGQQVQYVTIVNPQPDPNETITLTLSVTSPGVPPLLEDVTDRLVLVFVDGDQGLQECILCYIEWLGRFAGFDPQFGSLHHVDYGAREGTALWAYYTAAFDHYSPELAGIVATNPSILWSSLDTLDEWTPHAASLGQGNGDEFVISQKMVNDATALMDGVKAQASLGLQAFIQREQEALDLPSFVGLDAEQAWDELVARRPISQLFITIVLKH